MIKNILDILEHELLSISEYVSEDGKVLKAKVYEDAMSLSPKLIKLLLENESLKKQFFKEVEGIVVFDKQQFAWLVESKEFLPDSYTHYKNKIGLTDGNNHFISSKKDVVLSFPYKDCVLVGGQDKDEQKRDEIFFNEIVASEQITRMLAPKVLTNAKRYTVEGVEEDIEFQEDDNLIIKGNNLIALSTLLEKYEEKVKCVFIDPPYYFDSNKPSDTFSYNSNFKLSSWLTFNKNRLELTRKLMNDKGILFITISDEGAHYLKVMVDDVFGIDNFIADVTWESRKSVSSDGLFSQNSNHILIYAKDKNKINKNEFRLALDVETFKYKDERGKYRVEPFDAPNVRKNLEYVIKNPNTGEEYLPPKGRCWRTEEKTYLDYLEKGYIKFGVNGKSKPQLKTYYKDAIKSGKGKASSTIWHDISQSIIWQETKTNTNATKDQMKIFGENIFTNPKPEDLVKRAIELATDENDIVLDYYMGSATTQATAMKMNRRFIGCEQMDYIEDVSVQRLVKVIEGEQTGISKEVDWQGGGSFVYCELLENANELIKTIENATNASIENIKEMIYTDDRIIPYITTDELIKLNDIFNNLDLTEKKKALISLVDKNKLYVNYSDMDDENYKVNEYDKKITKSFYEEV